MKGRYITVSGKQIGELLIKEIKKKSSSIVVVFSFGDKLKLSPSTYTEFRLYPGKEVSKQEYDEIISYSNNDYYYDYALGCLSKDNYTVFSLTKKLVNKGATSKQTEDICKRLMEEDLINDERYAKTYAHDVAKMRCLGKRRILADLKEKGVPASILDNLQFSYEEEFSKALEAARAYNKKYAKATNQSKKEKVIRALLVRGFEEEIAKTAAKEEVTPNDEMAEKARLRMAFDLAYIRYSRKYEGYQRSQKVMTYLLKQGYRYEDIKPLMEAKNIEEENDD